MLVAPLGGDQPDDQRPTRSSHLSLYRRVLQPGVFFLNHHHKDSHQNDQNHPTSFSRDEFANTWRQFARGGGLQVLAILGGLVFDDNDDGIGEVNYDDDDDDGSDASLGNFTSSIIWQ